MITVKTERLGEYRLTGYREGPDDWYPEKGRFDLTFYPSPPNPRRSLRFPVLVRADWPTAAWTLTARYGIEPKTAERLLTEALGQHDKENPTMTNNDQAEWTTPLATAAQIAEVLGLGPSADIDLRNAVTREGQVVLTNAQARRLLVLARKGAAS